jgi:hypothetical protein
MAYIFNDNYDLVDLEFDEEGDFAIPPDGTFITRHGKQWKVVRHTIEETATGPPMLPIVRINVTDQF